MRIFITGIAGFLGSHLAEVFLADGHEVYGCDNYLGGYQDNVPKGALCFHADCCDWSKMTQLMAQQPDVVYHCAATAYEGLSVFSPSLVSRNIIDASTTVFSAAIANKVKRIVHCSSMARYGEGTPPFKETMTPLPQDPYGISKLAAEQMLRNLCTVHGVEYVIAVPHNIYGPRQKYDDPFRNVASIMMNMMLQNNSPIIYGDGNQQRCFSYVSDCLSSLKAMATAQNVIGQTINIGPDEDPITINELYSKIARVVGFNGNPLYMPGRPQEVRVALCSSDKARRMLDYQTTTSLSDGLWKMYGWMKKRGPRKFIYHLPIEIKTDKTPKTWTERLF